MNRTLFFKALHGMAQSDLEDVHDAYQIAKDAHRTQKNRDDGDRYFEHPREVAHILIELNYRSASIVIKALLHDAIEDTYMPRRQIINNFGREKHESLMRLSKYIPVFDAVTGKIQHRYKKDTAEYFKELSEGPVEDQLVKIADRLHNLRSCLVWPLKRRQKYVKETRRFILPMAIKHDMRLAHLLEEAMHTALRAPETADKKEVA